MNKNLELYEEFTLTPGSFDRYSNITPYAIFDIFQEVASRHADQLNAGFNKTNSKTIWLLLRSKYEILHNITKPIKLKVKTWPLKPKRIDYERDYIIFDEDDNILIKGTSKWCIYDLDTMQISRTAFSFNGNYLDERNYQDALKKIDIFPLEDLQLAYEFKVTPSYLDLNNHMNNAKYSFVLIDALDLNKNQVIKSVEFNFIKELLPNDSVSIYLKSIDNVYYCYGYVLDELHFSSKVVINL